MKNFSRLAMGMFTIIAAILILVRCGSNALVPPCVYTAFTTVDNYQLDPANGSSGYGIAADASGNLFASGYGDNGTNGNWIVRKSSDLGATWTTIDSFSSAGDIVANRVVIDASGTLFVGGQDNNFWRIRKSTDKGITWSSADSYHPAGVTISVVSDMKVAPSGRLIAVGTGVHASNNHWVVRTSADGGTTWSTIDDFELTVGNNAEARGVTVDSAGTVYVSGTASDGTNNHWVVRRSSDNGASWTTVDDYRIAGGATDYANGHGITVDDAGVLFASGSASDAAGSRAAWTTRKSGDRGTTWSTVDSFGDVDATSYSITNLAGNILAFGSQSTPGFADTYWEVRTSRDGGATWKTIDELFLAPLNSANANSATTDPARNLYVIGYAGDGNSRWIVRKAVCGQ